MTGNFDVPIFKTIKETAEITGLSQYFIRKLVVQNRIRYIKSGSKYLINVDYLIEFLKSGKEGM